MKNILFVSPTGTLDNGAELSIIQLMSLLKKRGYNVINMVQEAKSPLHELYDLKMAELEIPLYKIRLTKWWWPEAPGGVIPDLELATFEYQDALLRIRNIILEHQIDLVISNTVNVFLGAIAASVSKIPHFWLIHEFPENEFAYYKSKMPFVLAMSEKVFTVDGALKEVWQKAVSSKAVDSFIPYTEIVPRDDLVTSTQPRFVSVGRLSERKNQIALLQAYQQLGRNDIELLFIGPWDENYKIFCDDFINRYHLTNVKFLGYQDSPWDLLTDRDICIFPSRNETFGLVYIEAILNGVPVIASDNLGHQTVQNYFELPDLYSVDNIEELVNRMVFALGNVEALKLDAILFQKKVAEKYTPEMSYQSIIKSIEEQEELSSSLLQAVDFLLLSHQRRSKLELLGRKTSQILTRLRQKILYSK